MTTMPPLESAIRHGALAERRNPNPLFDTAFYLDRNPDVAISGLDPLDDYYLHGDDEGLPPGPEFDPAFYVATYPDVRYAGINSLLHFIRYGSQEGRDPRPPRTVPGSGADQHP